MLGIDVLKTMRSLKKICTIPVIILTVLGEQEDVKRGMKAGADAYFIKSNTTPAEIVKKAKELLKK